MIERSEYLDERGCEEKLRGQESQSQEDGEITERLRWEIRFLDLDVQDGD